MINEVHDHFKALCEIFQRSPAISAQQCGPSPNGSPFDGDQLYSLIAANLNKIPSVVNSYGQRLGESIQTVTKNLEKDYYRSVWAGESDKSARGYARLRADTAVGAVVDWAQPELRPQLKYFAAVADELFRLAVRKKQKVKSMNPDLKIRDADVPPLVTFAPTPGWGPSTLTSEALEELGGPATSVVSLPLGYKDDPIMWGILAHEVCGHDTVHAIDGLMEELKEKITADPLAEGWSSLWRNWAEETVADVLGVLSFGPYYAIGLAAWLSASAALDPDSDVQLGKLRNRLNVTGGRILDQHPVDLLRLHLSIGVVECLGEDTNGSSDEPEYEWADRDAWVKALEAIADKAAEGISTIDVYQDGRSVVLQYPLDRWKQEARKIGQYIATVKLNTLCNHSIQEVETWSTEDERRVREIIDSEDFSRMKPDDGDIKHLIAAAFGLLFKGGSSYGSVTDKLRKAFAKRYATASLLQPGDL